MPPEAEEEITFRQQIIKELRRIEDKIDLGTKATEHHRTPWQVRMGDITAIIAVLGLVWTASQAFGRLDTLDKSNAELKERIKPIEQIGWKLDGLSAEVAGMKQADKESAMQVSEIHQTLIRMGVNVAGKQK